MLGSQADGCDILRALLDPEHMPLGQKDRFLELFYNTYTRWLVHPFAGLSQTPVGQLACESTESKNAKYLLCEVLSFCVQNHGFRMKYFSIKNNTLGQLIQLCRYPDRFLRLGGIRFVRRCIGVKDTFFPRYIVKNDLMKLVFEVLVENGTRNTMTRSTVAEMLHHIAAVPVKPLLTYISSKYSQELDLLPSKELAKIFRMKSEQLEANVTRRKRGASDGSGKTIDEMDKHVSKQQRRFRQALSEESYFDGDDDGDNSTGASGGGGGEDRWNADGVRVGNGHKVAVAGASPLKKPPLGSVNSLDLLETWDGPAASPPRSPQQRRHAHSPPTAQASSSAPSPKSAVTDDDDDARGNSSSSIKKARLGS